MRINCEPVVSVLGMATILAVVLAVPEASGFEPKWPAGRFDYLVVDQDVRDILQEYGHNLGVPVKVSGEIKEQRVVGPLPVESAQAFLKTLCGTYGLLWYYDGTTLHFSSETELKNELINLGRFLRSDMVVTRLERIGAADARYPIRGTADVHVLSVSGPPAYRTLVRQEVIAMAKAAEGGVVVVRAGKDRNQ